MTNIKQPLGQQVNDLRVRAGKKPYTNPNKRGGAKLQEELLELTVALDLAAAVKAIDPIPENVLASQTVKAVAEEAIGESAVEKRVAEHDAARALKPKAKPVYRVTEEVDVDALVQPGKQETIRAMSERLLAHVHHVDPADKRTVGLMYGTIIALIMMKFTKAETSIECLRWYGVHMRAEDRRLPQKRPRPSNKL